MPLNPDARRDMDEAGSPMKSTSRQILANTMTGWGSVFARAALAFFLVPFLLQQLGRSAFGIVGLLGVLLNLTEVADLGLRQALGRELAEMAVRKDLKRYNELASTGFLLYLGIGVMLAAGVFIFSSPFIAFFNVPETLRPMATRAIQTYGAGAFLLSLAGSVFPAALISVNRFDLRNNIEAGSRIATGVALIAGLNICQNGLLAWVWITLGGQFLGVGLMACAARKHVPWLRLRFAFARLKSAFELLKFGWKVYVLQLTNLVAERSDPLVVSRFFGPAGVALYMPGSQLAGMVRPILLTLAAQLHPLATQHHVSNDLQKQQQMLIEGTRFTMLLGSLFSVGLFVFANPFCALWVGDTLGQDYRTVALVVQLWAVADFLACTASMQWPMMLGARNLNMMMIIHASTAVLNIGLSIFLVGFTPLGVPGALAGTILTSIILRPVLILYSTRVFNISFRDVFSRALARPFLLTACLLPITYTIRYVISPASYPSLLACAVLTGAAWLLLGAVIAFTDAERKRFFTVLLRKSKS